MSGFTPFSDNHESQIQITKDVLGTLIGRRSAWIHEEEHSVKPDQAKINAWENEQGDYMDMQKRLPSMTESEIADLLNTYDAKVKHEADADSKHQQGG